ncbi:magnesium transporter [Virgibacillus oceani]
MVKLDAKDREQYAQHIIHAVQQEDYIQFRRYFLELHPTDQIEIFNSFTKKQREAIYHYLSPDEFSEIFERLEFEKQQEIILELNEQYSSEMFNVMPADNAAYFLQEIPGDKAIEILDKMDPVEASEVKELLSYPAETAGAIMTKEVYRISSSDTASSVIEKLRKEPPDAETIYYLYVVDEHEKLVGVLSLRELITANETKCIEDIMSTRVVSVDVQMDQEDVALLMHKYDFLAMPVVSKNQTLLGIITVDDVMDVMEEEATEDFGEISAAKGATDVSVSAFAAAKKRVPWIIMLMLFGLVTAEVIGFFEETLEAIVLLAAFIPLIMDAAGNVGTQSLAVAVRGLALGTIQKGSLGRMVRREFATGLMLGLTCMIVLGITINLIYQGNAMLAFIVGISIFITLSISTIIGATVPLVINKLKLDPAIASGPFITTINDIIGLLIYFSIATTLIDYL